MRGFTTKGKLKVCLSLLLCIACLFSVQSYASAKGESLYVISSFAGQENYVITGGVVYEKIGGSAMASSYTKEKGKLVIADTVKIDGKTLKVTKIRENAFRGTKYTSVVIGKNVKSIGKNAFRDCKKLKKAKIKGSAVLGKNCFKGTKVKFLSSTALS